ncbi:hypothetical protein ACVR1I_04210 [Streptococcus cameli]
MKIEFYGPPGCGKTYIVEKLTGTSRELIRKKATSPFLAKLKLLSKYSPQSLYFKRNVKKILKNESSQPLFHETDKNLMIDSIILVATSYKLKIGSKNILDEGLVQRIISLAINFGLSNEKTIELIAFFEPLLKEVKVVSVSLSFEELWDSIKKRGRKESKMDYFDDATLGAFVRRYIELCEVVTSTFKFEEITRADVNTFVERNKIK